MMMSVSQGIKIGEMPNHTAMQPVHNQLAALKEKGLETFAITQQNIDDEKALKLLKKV